MKLGILVNAGLYIFVDHNYALGISCLLGAVSNGIFGRIDLTKPLTQGQKMAYSIAQYMNYASNFLGNAYECGNSGLFLYNKYVLEGRDFEMRDLLTIGGMLLNATSIKFAHSNMRKGLNNLDKVPTRKVGPDYESGSNANKVYFGQKAVSPNFSSQGTFKGASIQSVADRLASGELSADNLPIEYIVRDGKMITMNNRSLTALSKANMKPTVLIDITGDAANEAKLTQRLSEMGGQPSESILIRKIGEIVHIPN